MYSRRDPQQVGRSVSLAGPSPYSLHGDGRQPDAITRAENCDPARLGATGFAADMSPRPDGLHQRSLVVMTTVTIDVTRAAAAAAAALKDIDPATQGSDSAQHWTPSDQPAHSSRRSVHVNNDMRHAASYGSPCTQPSLPTCRTYD